VLTPNRPRLRALTLLAAVLSLVLIAACGDDDTSGSGVDSGDAAPFDVSVENAGGSVAFDAPQRAAAGLTAITLANESKKPEDLQLIKVEGKRSEQEVVAAYNQVGRGGAPIPAWFLAGGGVPTTGSGDSATVEQVLEPGTYYGFTSGTQGHMSFQVTGQASDAELPEADATVSAFEYGFKAEGLKSGENRIRFENMGAQPHHMLAFPIIGNASVEDVKQFVKTEKGKPPVDFEQEVSTAVLEGQTSQLVDVKLGKPGRYALLCFISDRQGGPPHALKGMVTEVDVE